MVAVQHILVIANDEPACTETMRHLVASVLSTFNSDEKKSRKVAVNCFIMADLFI